MWEREEQNAAQCLCLKALILDPELVHPQLSAPIKTTGTERARVRSTPVLGRVAQLGLGFEATLSVSRDRNESPLHIHSTYHDPLVALEI